MATKKSHEPIIQTIYEVILLLVMVIVYSVMAAIKSIVGFFRSPKSISGEVALITGAGSGIGRLTALRLARLNVKVVVWDINENGIDETVKLIEANGGFAKGYVCDIRNREEVYRVAKKTTEEVGEISILINNAGVVSGKLLMETSDELIQRTFDVNIIAHFWTTKAFLPAMMKKNSGHIVTIASLAGHLGTSKLVDYCSSKYAAVGFDESLRDELEHQGYDGIITTCICPYFIQSTGMFEDIDTRFLPVLSSNQVAEKIVQSILYNEQHVVIPKYLSSVIFLKTILPQTVFSYVLRSIVKDAHVNPPPEKSGEKTELNSSVPEKKGVTGSPEMLLHQRTSGFVERKP